MQRHTLIPLCGLILLAACVTAPETRVGEVLPALENAPLCESAAAALSIEHATANISACDVRSKRHFDLTIRPENTPINDSGWYGFRVDPKTTGTLRVTLKYEDGKHRYKPKLSYNGDVWSALPESKQIADGDKSLTMRLGLDGRSFYVSAQEILTREMHDSWTQNMAALSFVTATTIGASRDSYPIQMLEVKTDESAKPYVMLVGRQHPPEVTGALALTPFSETVLGNSPLAQRFRENFNVLIVPMINPDGVTAGYWRHNKGGIDLNRDWGPFTQPETQAIKSALKPFEDGDERIALFLDFHSTQRNLLYTQADDEPTSPPMFARDWTAAVDARLDDDVYTFTREARHNSGRPTSKNYMFENFGIAAITYEVGDETDRDAIIVSAQVFAEEMMRILLETNAAP